MRHTHKKVLYNRRSARVYNHKNVINLIVIRKIKVKIINELWVLFAHEISDGMVPARYWKYLGTLCKVYGCLTTRLYT